MSRYCSDDFENLRSQFATSSLVGRRKLPLAFTEHGAFMVCRRDGLGKAAGLSGFTIKTVAARERIHWPEATFDT